jgi:hypothetical protein
VEAWTVAAALFAGGAFALALLAEIRRWQSRPAWSWAAQHAVDTRNRHRHRLALQLVADHPAYHVTVEGIGLTLDQTHHDHDHDRTTWPHLAAYAPTEPPLVLYVIEDGAVDVPHLEVVWQIPPVRRGRYMIQRIDVRGDETHAPEWLTPPWGVQAWRRIWQRTSS